MTHRATTIVLSLCIVAALFGGCTCGSVGTGVVAWVSVNGWPSVGTAKAGPRGIVILRESAEDTPATARLWTALRNPPHSDYLTSKGHKLLILDDDQSPEWAEALKGVKPPAMAITDPASKAILDKRTVDVEAGAAGVIAAIKSKGG